MSDSYKILQIMPATDWVAQFNDDDGDVINQPLVCFALTEVTADGDSATMVRPMVWVEDSVEFCDEIDGFTGVVREDELDDGDEDEEE